jgi:hypothetical protein
MTITTKKDSNTVAQEAVSGDHKSVISTVLDGLVDKVVAARSATAAALVAEWAPVESKRKAAEKPKLP